VRGMVLVLASLLHLPSAAPAQRQVELELDWRAKVPGVTDQLSPKKIEAWRQRQLALYLKEFQETLRFWEFKPAKPGAGTIWFSLEPLGRINPELWAYARVQPAGISYPMLVWSCRLYDAAQLSALIDSGYEAELLLDAVTTQFNELFLERDFHGNIAPLFKHAWVAEGILEKLTDGTVGLPLPWDRLKALAQSVFQIVCDDPMGGPVPLEADGLNQSYSDKKKKEYLRVRPRKPMQGLTPRRIFVLDPREQPLRNPNLDEAPPRRMP
jgi:hypothetical protein